MQEKRLENRKKFRDQIDELLQTTNTDLELETTDKLFNIPFGCFCIAVAVICFLGFIYFK